jgi:hypothetical protein
MNHFKKCKVVMLPEKSGKTTSSNIWIVNDKLKYGWAVGNPQHLYILSDEEIKPAIDHLHNSDHEFSYYYVTKPDGNINTDYSANGIWFYAGGGYYGDNIYRRVIATTDPSLEICLLENERGSIYQQLPRPSDSFIKKYCELNGIAEVMVEYEELVDETQNDWFGNAPIIQKLKVAPDNTITIKKVRDSYSRKEVLHLFQKFNNEALIIFGIPSKVLTNNSFDKWIEENL